MSSLQGKKSRENGDELGTIMNIFRQLKTRKCNGDAGSEKASKSTRRTLIMTSVYSYRMTWKGMSKYLSIEGGKECTNCPPK